MNPTGIYRREHQSAFKHLSFSLLDTGEKKKIILEKKVNEEKNQGENNDDIQHLNF